MGVQDAALESGEQAGREDGAPAGHHHEVDVVLLQDVDHALGVGLAIEVISEALPLDQLGGDTRGVGDVDAPTGAVRDHQLDRDALGEDGFENRSTTRNQHRDTHRSQPTSRCRGARSLLRREWSDQQLLRHREAKHTVP